MACQQGDHYLELEKIDEAMAEYKKPLIIT